MTRVRYVVVGMGLNVNNTEFPPELESIATSLCLEAGQKFSRVELVAALLRALDREQAALSDGATGWTRRGRGFCGASSSTLLLPELRGGGGGRRRLRGRDSRTGRARVFAGGNLTGTRTVLSGGVRKR